ncbi:hypothetical protein ADUPG1_008500 [Aduncisulcus paluster]|uniref:Uncharacterized protein n=1 Tax=Aduncisulcus paluster TaxID=2918883 RepID=A0ABQ5KS78_9EUKA|nr:hypothetical protein ADUPG1_008500 [Aduncisulcus paluster]
MHPSHGSHGPQQHGRGGPQHGGSSHGGPSHGGPSHGGPSHGGPSHGGPSGGSQHGHGGPQGGHGGPQGKKTKQKLEIRRELEKEKQKRDSHFEAFRAREWDDVFSSPSHIVGFRSLINKLL